MASHYHDTRSVTQLIQQLRRSTHRVTRHVGTAEVTRPGPSRTATAADSQPRKHNRDQAQQQQQQHMGNAAAHVQAAAKEVNGHLAKEEEEEEVPFEFHQSVRTADRSPSSQRLRQQHHQQGNHEQQQQQQQQHYGSHVISQDNTTRKHSDVVSDGLPSTCHYWNSLQIHALAVKSCISDLHLSYKYR